MKIDLLKNSFINISKNIYDSDFINLAKINDEKICFDFSKNILIFYPDSFSESSSFLIDDEILKEYRKKDIAIAFYDKFRYLIDFSSGMW